MKILIVRLFPYEIDITNYNVQEIGLAKALIKKGNQCDIVLFTKTRTKIEKLKVENGEINIFWMKALNFFKNGIYGKELLELTKKYDIVQSSEYDQLYNLKLLKKIPEKLVIYHGPYYSKFNRLYNLKCKFFDAIFLNKKYKKVTFITKSNLATEFLKSKGFENVTTVGVGLDIEKIDKIKKDDVSLFDFPSMNGKKLLYIRKNRRTKKYYIFN